MKSKYFPPFSEADEQGFLCWSPDLEVEYVKDAYENGIFPWPQSEREILWFSPPERGIIEASELRLNRSLVKFIKKNKNTYEFAANRNFHDVVGNCKSQPRPDQEGTWITPKILKTYKELHKLGFAHSFEVYREGEMVAGLYGVFFGRYFSAESMFFKETNASKIALLFAIDQLKNMGCPWIDIQMLTPVTESLGGKYILRDEFLKKIYAASPIKFGFSSSSANSFLNNI